jgi:hypothetical protein
LAFAGKRGSPHFEQWHSFIHGFHIVLGVAYDRRPFRAIQYRNIFDPHGLPCQIRKQDVAGNPFLASLVVVSELMRSPQ